MHSRRNAGVQGKSSNLADSVIEGLVTGRQRLEGEHLATLLRPNGDTVGDRRTQELLHRTGLEVIPGQVAVLRILFQQPLAFEVAANAHCQCLGQSGQLGAGRCLHPVETQRAIGTLDLNSVQEQHMEMDIQIQCAAKALNQGDRAGLSRPTREPGLPDRVRGDNQLPARCLSCLPDRTALCRQRLVRQGYADIPDDRGRRQLEGASGKPSADPRRSDRYLPRGVAARPWRPCGTCRVVEIARVSEFLSRLTPIFGACAAGIECMHQSPFRTVLNPWPHPSALDP